jgi:O-antigen/teichoic acid export membrane protein
LNDLNQATVAPWSWQDLGRQVFDLRRSRAFRGHASNAAFGVIEYLCQPLWAVLSAPYLVPRLGLDQYGIWMLVSAFAGTVGILHVGLGDATIKYVSAYRGRNDAAGVARIVSGTLALSLLFGGLSALTLFFAAPFFVGHVFKIHPANYREAVQAIQLGALVLWIQCVYQVFANTLKAHEQYGPPTKIAVFTKSAVMIAAIVLVALGHGVVSILVATAVIWLLGTICQAIAMRPFVSGDWLWPSLDRAAWRELLGFGSYSWMQNTAGVVFSQADRLLVAAVLGTAPLTYYVLCVQVAQQIHGLVAAAFGFLFPHISSKHEAGNRNGIRRAFKLAVMVNIGLSVCLTLPLVVAGRRLLTLWMGPQFAAQSHVVLVVLAIGFCALSVNVAPHFTLLGLGQVRFVSFTNVVGGLLSLAGAALLISPLGLIGVAAGRLFYGPAISINYLKVAKTV